MAKSNATPVCRKLGLKTAASSAVLAVSLLSAGIAVAQSAAPQDEPATLDEVIVTSQKRSERIQDVPASVSFVSGEALAAQGARGLQDYAAFVPGLQVDTNGTPGQVTVTLRGISPLGSGAAVGSYVDDAPLGSSGFYAQANSFQLDMLPYDLRGVEVLRGPQGTLYGASTMGGLIKYTLAKANSQRVEGALGGDVSGVPSDGDAGYGLRGMLNMPLIKDRLAVRVSAFRQDTGGYIDNPGRSLDNINSVLQSNGRLALSWTPTDDVEVTFDALRQEIRSEGNAIVPLDPSGRPAVGDLKTNLTFDEPFRQKTDFLKATLNWNLPIGALTAVSSYSESRNRQSIEVTPMFVSLFPLLTGEPGFSLQAVDIGVDKFTQEVRLTSESGGTFEWLVGAFYTEENVTNEQYISSVGPDRSPNALNPLLTASIPSRYRETAAFGNLTWRPIAPLSISGGLRHSRNDQRYAQFTGGAFGVGDGGGTSSENVTTYSASAKYELTPQSMIYTRIASGYQPGGANIAAAGVPPTVGPSKLTNYEFGLKGRFLDNRLMLDAALFRMDWTDIQVIATTPEGVSFLVNGGKACSQGLEASGLLQVAPGLTLGANLSYTDAAFDGNIAEIGAPDGLRLPHVPRFSGSVTAEYERSVGGGWDARFGSGLRYVGERPSYNFSPTIPPVTSQEEAYVAVDLNVHLVRDVWDIGVFARNVFDERAYITKGGAIDAVSGNLVQINGALLQPRTIGISVDRRF